MNPSERELEDRVVTELRAAGLVRPGNRRPIFASLAAGLAMGIAGVLALQQVSQDAPLIEGKAYFLALYQSPGADGPDHSAEYSQWARAHAEGPAEVVGGAELADSGSLVLGRVPNTPSTLAGYFTIRAADEASAMQLARSNPHLKYGGTIVVRPIVD